MENTLKGEYKWPARPYGNFLLGWSSAFAWGLSAPGGPDKGEFKVSEAECTAAIEQQITRDVAVKGSLSISELLEKKIPQLLVAIAERSPRRFLATLGEAAKVEIKFPGMIGPLPWEVGFQVLGIATTPVTLKAKPSWTIPFDTSSPANRPLAALGLTMVVKGEIAALVGLSPAGWSLVASRVSPQVFRSFFAEAGTNLLGSLNAVVASGTLQIAGIGVLAMLAYTGAGLYAIGRASKSGDLENLAGFAADAYVSKVWGRQRHGGWASDPKLQEALVRHGESLALEHAWKVAAEVPGVRGSSDESALLFYRQFLETYHGGQTKAYEITNLKVRQETYDALRKG